ncbi:MAG: dienelactone hydrolase family protein [Proteobacteria bacterium]|nr:dienelactone hydrolase family protein [Pseudomonadota bacterium]
METRFLRTFALLGALGAVAIAAVLSASAAAAGELVHFDLDWKQPSQCERLGYLARPQGAGTHPAIIVLHGSSGFAPETVLWAERLASWGYVGLAIDSSEETWGRDCGRGQFRQTFDALAARRFLIEQPYVSAGRIGVIGFSMGAGSGLALMERRLTDQSMQAVVAVSPPCAGRAGIVRGPTLILIGELDELTPAAACRDMMARRNDEGAELRLLVYPEAHHGFTAPSLKPGRRWGNGWIEYNEAAANAAIEETRRFLQATLSEAAH